MVELDTGIADIIKNTRKLFRKSVWLEVAGVVTASTGNSNDKPRVMQDENEKDGWDALKRTNWNLVQTAEEEVFNSKPISVKTERTHPLAIVMLEIDLTVKDTNCVFWGDSFVEDVVRHGRIYGTIQKRTHIIVQVKFTGLQSAAAYIPYSTDEDKDAADTGDQTICVMILDSDGLVFFYNVPGGAAEHLAGRCAQQLLKVATSRSTSTINIVTPNTQRSLYDDCLYAIYITSACAFETTRYAVNSNSTPSNIWRGVLPSCVPSSRNARPTRVVANMRFLMQISKERCGDIAKELLLDERNTLDMFRKTVMETSE
jgi:hypothetical protein